MVIPDGPTNCPLIATAASRYPGPAWGLPGVGTDRPSRGDLPDQVVIGVGDIQIPRTIDGHRGRCREGGRRRRRAVPLKPGALPLPATVEMLPPDTLRIRLFPLSAMYKFPEPSTLTLPGLLNSALIGALPSPEKPLDPFPTIVVMVYPVVWADSVVAAIRPIRIVCFPLLRRACFVLIKLDSFLVLRRFTLQAWCLPS